MSIEVKKLESLNIGETSSSITILPSNFTASQARYHYHSNSISFYKYARRNLELSYLTEPSTLLEQRSGDWFGPVLLISHQLIVDNPTIVSVICGVIANYLTDTFKGARAPKVNLKVIYKKSKASEYVEINYTGDVQGVSSIESAIKSVIKDDR